MDLTLAQKIIQVLLFEGTSMKILDVAKFLNIKKEEVVENIDEVKSLLQVINLKLIQSATSIEIALSDEINSLINKNKIEELKTDLSESALQTLAVIIYKNKATKAEIDFVRGVDSVRSIKNLLTRGIIEKLEEKNKKYYTPTTETLRYLNLEKVDNAKDFSEISDKLKVLIEGE
jgi:segregation and condensation protein B